MKKGLFALALGTFTLGMTEFIIEGIITDVAHNMNVSIPEAGHLISIYALGVCAGAFSLILMHKYRPKKILMFLAFQHTSLPPPWFPFPPLPSSQPRW